MNPPTLTDSERHEIVAVLQEMDPSAPAEKRRSARRKVLMELEIQVLQFNSRTIRQSVILANVSRRGVAILRDRPFTLGRASRCCWNLPREERRWPYALPGTRGC